MNGHIRASDDRETTEVRQPIASGGPPMLELKFVSFIHATVSLPLVSLFVCLISAILFQYEQVSRTDTCVHVPNLVPSVSAVTGISPQRYIWRWCIALHSAPRVAIGVIYYNYYVQRMAFINYQYLNIYRWLATIIFYVYNIEIAGLCGVTFIANVENYPVHEKAFIAFMVTSILHQLLTLIIFRLAHPDMQSTPEIARSFRYKCWCFGAISMCTAALLYFFIRHKLYCEPGAFTMFSSMEYLIAVVNIMFHWTVVFEGRNLKWSVAQLSILPNLEVNDNQESAVNANSHRKQQ